MKKYFYLLMLFITILLGGCKHEVIPAPISNTPIFGIEGSIGTDSLSLLAGVNGAEMKPSLIQVDGIKIYCGTIANSESSFQLQIYNGNIDYPNQPQFDPNTIQEFLFIPTDQGALWAVNKASFPNSSSIVEIKWFVNGVAQVLMDELKIYKPGKYDVCAHVKFENQSVSILCREITVGFKKNADFQMQYEVISGSQLTASITNVQSAISGVKWYLNDQYISAAIQLDTLLPSSKYNLRAEVTFDNGIVFNRAAVVDVSWGGNDVPDFSQIATQATALWDYKAKISYLKDGISYTSENNSNQDNKIQVEEIVYHGVNSNGIPVYILKGEINVILQDSNMVSLPLKAKLVFGVLVN